MASFFFLLVDRDSFVAPLDPVAVVPEDEHSVYVVLAPVLKVVAEHEHSVYVVLVPVLRVVILENDRSEHVSESIVVGIPSVSVDLVGSCCVIVVYVTSSVPYPTELEFHLSTSKLNKSCIIVSSESIKVRTRMSNFREGTFGRDEGIRTV